MALRRALATADGKDPEDGLLLLPSSMGMGVGGGAAAATALAEALQSENSSLELENTRLRMQMVGEKTREGWRVALYCHSKRHDTDRNPCRRPNSSGSCQQLHPVARMVQFCPCLQQGLTCMTDKAAESWDCCSLHAGYCWLVLSIRCVGDVTTKGGWASTGVVWLTHALACLPAPPHTG